MATYKERVAALKKAGKETKRKHAEAKAKKPSLLERMKKGFKAKKVAKQKEAGGVKTGVSKSPKYKGASKPQATIKERAAKQKKHLAKMKETTAKKKEGKTWTKAVKKQKKTGGPSMNELIKARNAAKKGSSEYAAAQNQINKAYGSKKVHKAPAKSKDVATVQGPNPGPTKDRKYMSEGGKVESNPYGWPSRDARNGGKG